VAGGANSILLYHNACLDCEIGTKSAVNSLVVETSNYLLSAWGVEPCISLQEGAPKKITAAKAVDHPHYSRRDLLFGLQDFVLSALSNNPGESAKTTPATTSKKRFAVDEYGLLPKFNTARPTRLLSALKSLGSPKAHQIESRFWRKLAIDKERCACCSSCVEVCPSKALIRNRHGSSDFFTLEFKASQCLQCGLCMDVCSFKAISWQNKVLTFALVRDAPEMFRMRTTVE
jgi:Pyruvate/2-oxoacid:ferredoxin oxidoreductase delta subunit